MTTDFPVTVKGFPISWIGFYTHFLVLVKLP